MHRGAPRVIFYDDQINRFPKGLIGPSIKLQLVLVMRLIGDCNTSSVPSLQLLRAGNVAHLGMRTCKRIGYNSLKKVWKAERITGHFKAGNYSWDLKAVTVKL